MENEQAAPEEVPPPTDPAVPTQLQNKPIFICTDWEREDPKPADCAKYVHQDSAWLDGYQNPYCVPCAKRRFTATKFSHTVEIVLDRIGY